MKLQLLLLATTFGSALLARGASAQTTSSTVTSSTTAPSTTATPGATTVAATQTTTSTQSTEVPADGAPPAKTSTTSGIVSSQGGPPVEDVPTQETTSPINRPLLATGAVVLGGTYVASAIDAAESSRYADHHYLYYPVVGPWLDLANRDCNGIPCNHETGNKVLLIADGVGQGLGALAVITSFFIPESTTRHWVLLGSNDKFKAGPTAVGTGYGLGAVGRF